MGRPGRLESSYKTGQHPYSFRRVENPLHYLLFLSDDYGVELGKKWPLLLFLHGIGERGDEPLELERLKIYGPPMMVEEQNDFPFIVVSPQCPTDVYWDSKLGAVEGLLDELVANLQVDPNRVYLTGLSMGGFGAWNLVLEQPERFAAVVPIAGGYEFESNAVPENICDLREVPIWVFHGEQDNLVLSVQSTTLVNALKACGGNIRYTLYPDADHMESWMLTYGNPQLLEWMLQQSLESVAQ
ncbi:MAG: prolyl oligopeptidase family serine peptidase [Anaerolineales bacterium]|nr:prolyl oligopeptidase family serine peptidase [Anaerolineales bacterium]